MSRMKILTLNFPEGREVPKPGQARSTPGKIILWNVLDDDVAVTSNPMNLGCGHPHEVRIVDDEENRATRCQFGVTRRRKVVTGAAPDVIGLH
jgi:hypothetical protein